MTRPRKKVIRYEDSSDSNSDDGSDEDFVMPISTEDIPPQKPVESQPSSQEKRKATEQKDGPAKKQKKKTESESDEDFVADGSDEASEEESLASESEFEEPTPKKKPAPKKAADAPKKAATATPKAKASKAVVAPKANQGEVDTALFDFMKKSNRPFNANLLVIQFAKRFKKAQVISSIQNLIDQKQVQQKDFGKTTLYLVSQDLFPKVDPSELSALEAEVNKLAAEKKAAVEENKVLTAELKTLNSQLSTAEMKEKIETLRAENTAMREKVERLAGGVELISADKKKEIEDKYRKYRTEWKKRKRIVKDFIDKMSEGMEKHPKELFETIGIETDEEVGVELGPDKFEKPKAPFRNFRR